MNRNEFLLIAALIGLYLATRLPQLTLLPITSDEATFIHWAQIMLGNIREILIAKTDGRQPLFSWLALAPVGIFGDPLWAGRLISVFAGSVSLAGLYILGRRLRSPSTGALAGLIYIFCPYTFIYDRLALPASLTHALGIWAVAHTFHIIKEGEFVRRDAVLLGAFLGLALLSHSTALLLIPVVGGMLYFGRAQRETEFWKPFGYALALAILPTLFVLMTGPKVAIEGRVAFFHDPGAYLPLSTLASLPFDAWWTNMWAVREILITYLMLSLLPILAVALVYACVRRLPEERFLWLWFFMPIGTMIFFQAKLESSTLAIGIPPLILLSALTLLRLTDGLSQAGRQWWPGMNTDGRLYRSFACNLFLVPVLLNGLLAESVLWRNPAKAIWTTTDRKNYVEGMASGYGVRAAAEYLAEQGRTWKTRTGAPRTLMFAAQPGNPAEGISVYLHGEESIRQVPAFWWPASPSLMPTRVRFTWRASIYQYYPLVRREAHLLDHAFFIYPHSAYVPETFEKHNPDFHIDRTFEKPGGRSRITLYQHTKKKRPPE